jgi:predicted lipoprotein with Yx(FWY)xxD motif
MFTLSVPPFKAGSDLAGNWPLLTAKNYLTSNGNVKTVESSNFTTKLWMKGGKFL